MVITVTIAAIALFLVVALAVASRKAHRASGRMSKTPPIYNDGEHIKPAPDTVIGKPEKPTSPPSSDTKRPG